MPRKKSPPRQVQVYTQHGEHLQIAHVFQDFKGYAVEVGAGNGVSISNTKHLEDMGWTCLCIEPNPVYSKALRKNRKLMQAVACGKENADGVKFHSFEVQPGNFEAYSSLRPEMEMVRTENKARKKKIPTKTVKVNVRTLDWCLEHAKFPRVDLVSIDVEGTEMDVLDGFDIRRWNPRMVIIEDWRGGKFREYMCRRQYWLMARLNVNEIYVRLTDE